MNPASSVRRAFFAPCSASRAVEIPSPWYPSELSSKVKCVCMSIRPGSSVASGRSIVVSPAAAWTSPEAATRAILPPSTTIAWPVRS